MPTDFPPLPPAHLCDRVLEYAAEAARAGEIPVAAAIIRRRPESAGSPEHDTETWECLGIAFNRTATDRDPLAHAEIQAIQQARRAMQIEYLNDCAIISSLEPCMFCSGALTLSRIGAIYYFTPADKGIRLRDVTDLSIANRARGLRAGVSNHHPFIAQVHEFEEPARLLLSRFFQERRSLSLPEIPKAD